MREKLNYQVEHHSIKKFRYSLICQLIASILLALLVFALSNKKIEQLKQGLKVYKNDMTLPKYLDSIDFITREFLEIVYEKGEEEETKNNLLNLSKQTTILLNEIQYNEVFLN